MTPHLVPACDSELKVSEISSLVASREGYLHITRQYITLFGDTGESRICWIGAISFCTHLCRDAHFKTLLGCVEWLQEHKLARVAHAKPSMLMYLHRYLFKGP